VTAAPGTVKAAELASGLGAIVLGAGLALVLPAGLRTCRPALVVTGAFVHEVGMTLKCRLEARDGPVLWWERAPFWLCRASPAGLGSWLAIVATKA